jgi:hypothetical protein
MLSIPTRRLASYEAMMRLVALGTSVATILVLNIVLWLGLLGEGDTTCFGLMLMVLHVVLPISSILMVALLAKDRQWTGALLFAAVVTGMLVVLTLRLTEVHLSLGLHLGTDLCALNVYLIVVPRLLFSQWRRTTI